MRLVGVVIGLGFAVWLLWAVVLGPLILMLAHR